jgi:hypothetical protein
VYIHGRSFRNNFQYHRQLSEQLLVSQAAFGKPESFLEKITGRFFHISQFREASRNLFWFFVTQRQLKLWKPSALIQKVLLWILGPSKNIFILGHYPFKNAITNTTCRVPLSASRYVPICASGCLAPRALVEGLLFISGTKFQGPLFGELFWTYLEVNEFRNKEITWSWLLPRVSCILNTYGACLSLM